MQTQTIDRAFAGSIPQLYQQHLVPLIFQTYAADLATRVVASRPARVLEIAAGTGAVTRELAQRLPGGASIVATDLNQPMLDHAASLGSARPVEWRQADAMSLPFADGAFDAVACQFGVMFFADRCRAYAEVLRVLRPGGVFAFNVWDRIEDNEFAEVVTEALATIFPGDPPRFLVRVPHGYCDVAMIAADLARAGFQRPLEVRTIAARSRAESAIVPARAYCQGTPLRNEIEARDVARLDEATNAAASALTERFGTGAVDGKIQAHVVLVER